MKRFLSIVIAIVCMVSVCTAAISAAETEVADAIKYANYEYWGFFNTNSVEEGHLAPDVHTIGYYFALRKNVELAEYAVPDTARSFKVPADVFENMVKKYFTTNDKDIEDMRASSLYTTEGENAFYNIGLIESLVEESPNYFGYMPKGDGKYTIYNMWIGDETDGAGLTDGVEYIAFGDEKYLVHSGCSLDVIYTSGTVQFGAAKNVSKQEIIDAAKTTGYVRYNGVVCGAEVELKDTSKIFTDISADEWFKEYVDYSYTHKIFKGTSATTFAPQENITRAQFVQALANISNVDTSNWNVSTQFIDVPSGAWYAPAVKWASENRIVIGVGDGYFDPDANITREQMCLMLVNYARFSNITLNTVEEKISFADNSKISSWATAAVYACQQADIVNGKGENTFDPVGLGTRAEVATLFTRFHKEYLV